MDLMVAVVIISFRVINMGLQVIVEMVLDYIIDMDYKPTIEEKQIVI